MTATFVSVWDGGIEIRTDCEYNPITKEVSDIDIAEVDNLECLEDEYVELPDGTEVRDFVDEGNEGESLTPEEIVKK